MKIATRYFGEMEIDPQELVQFVQPLYGFEQLTRYALLSDSTIGDCFLWLQSVEEQDTCFILVDPQVLPAPYAPKLPEEALRALGGLAASEAVIRLVAVIPEDFTQATVNLKSPIVINTTGRCASQLMLEEEYPLQAPLVENGEGGPPC